MWGWNAYGQCGMGEEVENQLLPACLESLQGRRVLQVACGQSHSIALVSNRTSSFSVMMNSPFSNSNGNLNNYHS